MVVDVEARLEAAPLEKSESGSTWLRREVESNKGPRASDICSSIVRQGFSSCSSSAAAAAAAAAAEARVVVPPEDVGVCEEFVVGGVRTTEALLLGSRDPSLNLTSEFVVADAHWLDPELPRPPLLERLSKEGREEGVPGPCEDVGLGPGLADVLASSGNEASCTDDKTSDMGLEASPLPSRCPLDAAAYSRNMSALV